MRKSLIIALIGMIVPIGMMFTSCEIHNSEDCKFHAKSITLTVDQNEWKFFDKYPYQFYAHFDVPEITQYVYEKGNYSLHRIYNFARQDEYQVALPQSVFMIEDVTDGEGNTYEYYYTQEVDYRVGIGYVEVQVTNSDYLYEEDQQGYLVNPETMDFHLQLIW